LNAIDTWARNPDDLLPLAAHATWSGSIAAETGSFPAKSAAPVAPYAVFHAYIGSSSADFPCDRRGEFKCELDS
jgi:hypothetical protein